jgi:hypothetical protein
MCYASAQKQPEGPEYFFAAQKYSNGSATGSDCDDAEHQR